MVLLGIWANLFKFRQSIWNVKLFTSMEISRWQWISIVSMNFHLIFFSFQIKCNTNYSLFHWNFPWGITSKGKKTIEKMYSWKKHDKKILCSLFFTNFMPIFFGRFFTWNINNKVLSIFNKIQQSISKFQ